MPRRRTASVISFEPELLQFWIDASSRPIILRVPTHANAVRLRHRLYSCRAAMRTESHPNVLAAEQIALSIEAQPDGQFAVIGQTAGYEYKDVFAKAGVKIPEPPDISNLIEETEEPAYYSPDYKTKEK